MNSQIVTVNLVSIWFAIGAVAAMITASFTDTLNGTTPTGIFLDLLPFIILIIFGVLGIFLIKGFKYI